LVVDGLNLLIPFRFYIWIDIYFGTVYSSVLFWIYYFKYVFIFFIRDEYFIDEREDTNLGLARWCKLGLCPNYVPVSSFWSI
jgi:hypothetical protein